MNWKQKIGFYALVAFVMLYAAINLGLVNCPTCTF